eukprot:5255761-Prymnesium_polylepis.1
MAPAVWPCSVVRKRVACPPTIVRALSVAETSSCRLRAPWAAPGCGFPSIVQSVSVSSPASTLTLPRSHTRERCTGGARALSVKRRGCAGSAGRIVVVAPASPSSHTCEHAAILGWSEAL